MTPCSALSGTRRFGGTYRLHLQGCRIVSEAASKQVANLVPFFAAIESWIFKNLKSLKIKDFRINSCCVTEGIHQPVHLQVFPDPIVIDH
jgi:hypothetical protein